VEAYFHYRNIDVSTLKEWLQDGRPKSKTALIKNHASGPDDIIDRLKSCAITGNTLSVLAMNQLMAVALGGSCGAVVRF